MAGRALTAHPAVRLLPLPLLTAQGVTVVVDGAVVAVVDSIAVTVVTLVVDLAAFC